MNAGQGTASLFFKRFGLAILALVLSGAAAFADCRRLHILPDIVEAITYLGRSNNPETMALAGERIERLRSLIHKNRMYQDLEPLGLELRLHDIMRLKVKLGALSHIAMTQGPAKTKTYLNSSDFQRSYKVIQNLATNTCDGAISPTSSDQSDQTPDETLGAGLKMGEGLRSLNLEIGFATPQQSGVTMLTAALVSALAAAPLIYWINRRRKRRRRLAKRVACKIVVFIKRGDEMLTKTAVDISRTGANLECDGALAPGDTIEIDFDAHLLTAAVIWSNDTYAGVKFDRPVTASKFKYILSLSRLNKDQDAAA